jgi:mannose-1-phosphate guanylyltransferase
MLHAVIMAGGSGTRFWPESRRAHPKQFLTLSGDRSLLQQAVARCAGIVADDRIRVVTNAAHQAETQNQLPGIAARHILLEPCGRNTAPCIGLAAVQALAEDPEAVLLVTPADHVIRPIEAFQSTVRTATELITRHPQASVLFGIVPTHPATGYGYIERGDEAARSSARHVRSFREKPDRATAEAYLANGNYYWNSGIFVWRAARLMELLAEFQPEIHRLLQQVADAIPSGAWDKAVAEAFPRMPSISIDYGVLEKAADVFVVPAAFEWDDVGSWSALPRLLGQDAAGNTIDGPHCGLETRDCVIRSSAGHLVATIGLRDYVVIHTPDATLVAPRDDESALRRLVAKLSELGLEQFL